MSCLFSFIGSNLLCYFVLMKCALKDVVTYRLMLCDGRNGVICATVSLVEVSVKDFLRFAKERD